MEGEEEEGAEEVEEGEAEGKEERLGTIRLRRMQICKLLLTVTARKRQKKAVTVLTKVCCALKCFHIFL